MVIYSLALLAGICCFQFFPQLPPLAWSCVAALVAIVCWFKISLRPITIFLFGLLWAWWHASLTLSSRLPETYVGHDLIVQGYIENIPEAVSVDSYRFIFIVERMQSDTELAWTAVSFKTRLRWYKNSPQLRAHDRWQLRVRLKAPRGLANPGGFDYERWLFSQRIDATGYVKNSSDNNRLDNDDCQHIDCWRQQLSRKLKLGSSPEVAGLLAALAVGDKSGISHLQWDVLRSTGTAHLMAISGLHIGLIAGLSFAVTRWLWKLFQLVQLCPATRAAAVAAILCAFVYAVLGGLSLPTQRALIMVIVFMSGYLINRSVQPWRALCISLCLILLYEPLSVLSSGFWLSFGAVGWIFYVMSGRYGSIGKFKSALRIQATLTVGLLPVLLIGFQQASFTAPLANIIAVPVVGLIVVPAVLLASMLLLVWPSAGNFLVQIAGKVMQLLGDFLTSLDVLPFGVWQHDTSSVMVTIACLASVTVLLAPVGLALRLSGLLLLSPLLLTSQPRPEAGIFWLDLLDVGQGLSAVVRTQQHTLVYDAGPKSRSGFDMGKAVVLPFLISEGIQHIDTLMISHSDNDHQGGARSLFESIRTDSILSGMPGAIGFARSSWCHRDQHWEWEDVKFDVLSPVLRTKGNNASCVLKITARNGQRLLLTGDIETRIERQLVKEFGPSLRANVLVAPHHGSRTSSTLRFINEVEPEIVLFPAGFANRFGFPKLDIIERYRRQGAEILITGRDGAIRVELGHPGKLPGISRFRQDSRRYWQQTTAD